MMPGQPPASQLKRLGASDPGPHAPAQPPEPTRGVNTSATPPQGAEQLGASSTSAGSERTNATGERIVVRQTANIRVTASNTAAVARTAPQGAKLRVFARNAGWIEVGEEEPWGWVFSGLVEVAQ